MAEVSLNTTAELIAIQQPVLMLNIAPVNFCFYFILSLLEDIGHSSRQWFWCIDCMDSTVPLMFGPGGNVPGAMAGKVLETRRERFIISILLAICVPGMARLALVCRMRQSRH